MNQMPYTGPGGFQSGGPQGVPGAPQGYPQGAPQGYPQGAPAPGYYYPPQQPGFPPQGYPPHPYGQAVPGYYPPGQWVAAPPIHISLNPPAAPKPEVPKGPEWEPSPSETQQIYEWYRNLDEGGLEQVGGAKIVKFLASSNLSKDILRKIWELADPDRRGFVDRQQFTLIIRLVALACSPIYAGSTPTLERYHKTCKDESIPLPRFAEETPPLPLTSSSASASALPTASMVTPEVAVATPYYPPAQAPAPVAAAAHAPGPTLVWRPSPPESQQIAQWYSELDEGGLEQVGGAKIVKFLASSNLSKEVLRKIWELADPDRRGFVDRQQFTLIIRLVALACSPANASPGYRPSLEHYYSSLQEWVPLPPLRLLDGPIPMQAAAAMAVAVAAPTAPHANAASTVPVPAAAAQTLEDDEEFSDFTAAPLPAAAPSSVPAPAADPLEAALASMDSALVGSLGALDAAANSASLSFGGSSFSPAPASAPASAEGSMGLLSGAGLEQQLSQAMQSVDQALASSSFGDAPASSGLGLAGGEASLLPSPDKLLSLSAPVTPSVPASAPVKAAEDEEPSLLGGEVTYDTPLGQPNQRMRYLDALAETDLAAASEEWDDFAEAQHEAVVEAAATSETETAAQGQAQGQTQGVLWPEDAIDQPSDFLPPAQAPSIDISALEPTISADPAPQVHQQQQQQEQKQEQQEEEDENFGSFVIFQEPPAAAPAPATAADPALSEAFDAFSDLAVDTPPPLSSSLPALSSSSSSASISSSSSSVGELGATPLLSMSPPIQPRLSSLSSSALADLAELSAPASSTAAPGPGSGPASTLALGADKGESASGQGPSPWLSSSVKAQPLSHEELLALLELLLRRNHCPEAAACAAQLRLRLRLAAIQDEKRAAVDNDDLETALALKLEAASCTGRLASLEEEARWQWRADNGLGLPLLDSLRALEEAVPDHPALPGSKGAEAFCATAAIDAAVAGGSEALACLAEQQALAFRRSRLALALRSSHPAHGAALQRLLSALGAILAQATQAVDALRRLSQHDQEALAKADKLRGFIQGGARAAEAALLVAASAWEAGLLDAGAGTDALEADAATLLSQAAALGISSPMAKLGPRPVQELAAHAAARQGAPGPSCSLTLRPLSLPAVDDQQGQGLSVLPASWQDGSPAPVFANATPSGPVFCRALLAVWLRDVEAPLPAAVGASFL